MPVRATKRGAARHPFLPEADADVLICGASFAGLTVARELRATGASVLVLDRYEIGERQTSACAAPTEWLANLGLQDALRQTFSSLLVHTPPRALPPRSGGQISASRTRSARPSPRSSSTPPPRPLAGPSRGRSRPS